MSVAFPPPYLGHFSVPHGAFAAPAPPGARCPGASPTHRCPSMLTGLCAIAQTFIGLSPPRMLSSGPESFQVSLVSGSWWGCWNGDASASSPPCKLASLPLPQTTAAALPRCHQRLHVGGVGPDGDASGGRLHGMQSTPRRMMWVRTATVAEDASDAIIGSSRCASCQVMLMTATTAFPWRLRSTMTTSMSSRMLNLLLLSCERCVHIECAPQPNEQSLGRLSVRMVVRTVVQGLEQQGRSADQALGPLKMTRTRILLCLLNGWTNGSVAKGNRYQPTSLARCSRHRRPCAWHHPWVDSWGLNRLMAPSGDEARVNHSENREKEFLSRG